MARRWIICGMLFGCLSGSVLLAKPGILKTKDGRSIEGDITEKSDGVAVTVRGITTTVHRDNVDSIDYVGSIDQQYQDRLAKLPKNAGAAAHIELARWLFDNKAYALSRKELDTALTLDPNSTEATTLYQTVQSQMRLEATKPPATGNGGHSTDVKPPAHTTGDVFTAAMHKYLATDQINMLKQAEWPGDDATVKVTFNGDVKRKYVASAGENAAQFNSLSVIDQGAKILKNGTAEERKDVRIVNDPAPLADYKRTIQPMILTNCATAGCHGGPNGGKFFLYGTPESDAATYTNFYLLTQATGFAGGAKRMVIDRTYPDTSLIVQYGLPADQADFAHPEVKSVAWRPMFRGKEDPNYKALIRWMGKLVSPDPKYGFVFTLEGGGEKPQTQPASAPAPATRPTTRPAAK